MGSTREALQVSALARVECIYVYVYVVPAKRLTLKHTCMQMVHSAMKTERQRDRHTVVGAQMTDW